MSRHKNKLRQLLEYACLKTIIKTVDRMPLDKALKSAGKWADLWYFAHHSRRRIARENIRLSGIAHDEKEISRIARSSFRHFATLMIETLKIDPLSTSNSQNIHIENAISPKANDILNNSSKGLIIASGHVGNWEIAAQLLTRFKTVAAIARDMNNPYINQLVSKRRTKANLSFIPKYDNAISKSKAILKKGGVLAIMTDQHARKGGIIAEFLGRPASTYPTAALLHLATGMPICFCSCIRLTPALYRLIVLDPITHERTGNNEQDIRIITEKINRELEKIIREYPEQYLWGHRRWRVSS